jgi:hypothetical protein
MACPAPTTPNSRLPTSASLVSRATTSLSYGPTRPSEMKTACGFNARKADVIASTPAATETATVNTLDQESACRDQGRRAAEIVSADGVRTAAVRIGLKVCR